MANPNKKKFIFITVAGLVVVIFLISGIGVLKLLLKDDPGRRVRKIQRVTLVKPPPPKKVEKPPEPEIKKEKEIVEPEPEETPPEEMDDPGNDDTPPGEDLGLDSDGTGGSDGFGLRAKKGGRSLIGGGGSQSLMRRYAWYTRILQDELREKVNTYLEDKKELPRGKHKMVLSLSFDMVGNMKGFSIVRSSGNTRVDEAVGKAIKGFQASETPPEEMPRTMKVKVTFKS